VKQEDWKILNKIEQWAERLPYRHLKIEINLKDGTDLVYEKDKQYPVGFCADVKGNTNEAQNGKQSKMQ